MGLSWCRFCLSQHSSDLDCPGPLEATGVERHGWRVTVQTPLGTEAYGVLIAECDSRFRARILTFPNVLVTAHQGFFTEKALRTIAETTLENISAFATGHSLENVVTAEVVHISGRPGPAVT